MAKKKKKAKRLRGRISRRKTQLAGTCLVISPFGSWFDDYYEQIYIPAIEATGLKAIRADDLYKTGSIVNDIWDLTKGAKILLADLSGKNPNVFYELGLAHAIAKPVVLITDQIEDVPFDLRSLRVIPYNKHVGDWGVQLKTAITNAIGETLANPDTSILATFLQSQPQKSTKKISPERKAMLEMQQELDGLKNQVLSMSRFRPDVSGASEIHDRLQNYRKMGMPLSMAIERTASRTGLSISLISQLAESMWTKKRRRNVK